MERAQVSASATSLTSQYLGQPMRSRLSSSSTILKTRKRCYVYTRKGTRSSEQLPLSSRSVPTYPQRAAFIHFRHQKVHRFHSPSFLQALWKAPPSFKGKPMKLVSKGLAKGGIRVYTACLPLNRWWTLRRGSRRRRSWVEFILAYMYDVETLGGGPIFYGDLVLICSAAMTSFLGEACYEAGTLRGSHKG